LELLNSRTSASPGDRRCSEISVTIIGHYPDQPIQKFIQSFESWGDTMKKNSSFVNLFLEESARPTSERAAEWHLEANGIVVYQPAKKVC